MNVPHDRFHCRIHLETDITSKVNGAMKVLLNSFHLNGHTLGFYPQTEKLEPSYAA